MLGGLYGRGWNEWIVRLGFIARLDQLPDTFVGRLQPYFVVVTLHRWSDRCSDGLIGYSTLLRSERLLVPRGPLPAPGGPSH